MVVFPNCKINLGLHILRKRADGFHDTETIFYPLSLSDALEIVQADTLQFTCSGISVPGNTADNLCLKAYHLLKRSFRSSRLFTFTCTSISLLAPVLAAVRLMLHSPYYY
ncbi:hypothetical protein MKQ70_09380 [Chitinophaga sedimenti]|uniref:hypothetical protein n=1 Tax=Chitinophaga sedimenti TaxID=2033606 RepID=UPI0020030C75|nr:hypothetical protein [Chitinophaga sedimenti]MCK7555202.1 hypothetical protein [Chitinophaga sedimenti]